MQCTDLARDPPGQLHVSLMCQFAADAGGIGAGEFDIGVGGGGIVDVGVGAGAGTFVGVVAGAGAGGTGRERARRRWAQASVSVRRCPPVAQGGDSRLQLPEGSKTLLDGAT